MEAIARMKDLILPLSKCSAHTLFFALHSINLILKTVICLICPTLSKSEIYSFEMIKYVVGILVPMK